MRFYAALIASLLSNHRGVVVIGRGDVLSAERRYETTKGEREREKRKIWNQDEYSVANAYTRGVRPSEMKGCRTNRTRRGEDGSWIEICRGLRRGVKKEEKEKKRNCSLVDGT